MATEEAYPFIGDSNNQLRPVSVRESRLHEKAGDMIAIMICLLSCVVIPIVIVEIVYPSQPRHEISNIQLFRTIFEIIGVILLFCIALALCTAMYRVLSSSKFVSYGTMSTKKSAAITSPKFQLKHSSHYCIRVSPTIPELHAYSTDIKNNFNNSKRLFKKEKLSGIIGSIYASVILQVIALAYTLTRKAVPAIPILVDIVVRYIPWFRVHHVVRKFTERLLSRNHPPLFHANKGALLTFEEYHSSIQQEYDPPEFSGNIRDADGSGNNGSYPWFGQSGRAFCVHQSEVGCIVVVPNSLLSTPEILSAELMQLTTSTAAATHIQATVATSSVSFESNAFAASFPLLVMLDLCNDGASFYATRPFAQMESQVLNRHSAYLDLQTLYGATKRQADSIRTFSSGKVQSDVLADDRLLTLPVCRAILILFNREHNYICDALLSSDPEHFPLGPDDEEKLYQQARLINTACYLNCVKRELSCAIVEGCPRQGRPCALLDGATGIQFTDATGNHCSLEQNVLLSALVSQTRRSYSPKSTFNVEDILSAALAGSAVPETSLLAGTDELLFYYSQTIELERKNNLLSLNGMRRLLGLQEYSSFEAVNSDPTVTALLQKNFSCVTAIDLFTGLLLESKGGLGAGGTTRTLPYAVLTNMLCAVSHDRFYTSDFTSAVYTSWGLEHSRSTNMADLVTRHTRLVLPHDWDLSRPLLMPVSSGALPHTVVVGDSDGDSKDPSASLTIATTVCPAVDQGIFLTTLEPSAPVLPDNRIGSTRSYVIAIWAEESCGDRAVSEGCADRYSSLFLQVRLNGNLGSSDDISLNGRPSDVCSSVGIKRECHLTTEATTPYIGDTVVSISVRAGHANCRCVAATVTDRQTCKIATVYPTSNGQLEADWVTFTVDCVSTPGHLLEEDLQPH